MIVRQSSSLWLQAAANQDNPKKVTAHLTIAPFKRGSNYCISNHSLATASVRRYMKASI